MSDIQINKFTTYSISYTHVFFYNSTYPNVPLVTVPWLAATAATPFSTTLHEPSSLGQKISPPAILHLLLVQVLVVLGDRGLSYEMATMVVFIVSGEEGQWSMGMMVMEIGNGYSCLWWRWWCSGGDGGGADVDGGGAYIDDGGRGISMCLTWLSKPDL